MPDGYGNDGAHRDAWFPHDAAWFSKVFMARHMREDHGYSLSKIQNKLGMTRAELKRVLLEE